MKNKLEVRVKSSFFFNTKIDRLLKFGKLSILISIFLIISIFNIYKHRIRLLKS